MTALRVFVAAVLLALLLVVVLHLTTRAAAGAAADAGRIADRQAHCVTARTCW